MVISKTLLITPLLALTTLSSHAVLSITLGFDHTSSNYSALNNSSWDGGTSDATKRGAFETAVRTAADRWEYAYRNSTVDLTHTIDVSWATLSGNTLATGGSSWSNVPDYNFVSSSLKWDNDGSSNFYVDTAPTDTNEWAKFTNRSIDFGAGNVNVERVSYNANDAIVRANSELYSIALHEIGHTLGVLNSYPKYDNLDVGGDGMLNLSDGSAVPYNGGHTDISIGTPEYVDSNSFFYPYDGVSVGATYGPNAMSPSIVDGVRKELTAVDIQLIADIHGFDNIDTQAIPEPSSTSLIALGGLSLLLRRKRAV